jgi:hypothetical protein
MFTDQMTETSKGHVCIVLEHVDNAVITPAPVVLKNLHNVIVK